VTRVARGSKIDDNRGVRSLEATVAVIACSALCSCERAPACPPAAAPSVAVEPSQPPHAEEVHEQVAAAVFAALRDHDFDGVERHFDLGMRQAVPKEKVARVWSSAVAANGELLSWALTKRERRGSFERLHYDLTLENGHIGALVTFPWLGEEIAGLLVLPLGSPALQ